MPVPSDRKYLPSHEWHQANGDIATLGITQTAADELTDVTYVKLPKVGETVAAGSTFGEIESVKATSDLNTGVSGVVTAVNDGLTANPGLVNSDPFGEGWMIKVKMTNADEMNTLLSPADYEKKSGH